MTRGAQLARELGIPVDGDAEVTGASAINTKHGNDMIDDAGIWTSDGKLPNGQITSWVAYVGNGVLSLKVEETLGGSYTATVRGAKVWAKAEDIVDMSTAKHQAVLLAKAMIVTLQSQIEALEDDG